MLPFPYREVFQKTEESLINYGSRHLPADQIRKLLDVYKSYADRALSDELYYWILVMVTFYSGFRAATVSARETVIRRWFSDLRTAANYGEDGVTAIMSDPAMIRHKGKIRACIENAKIMSRLIEEHGSFANYIATFAPKESFENLLLLKEELEGRFHYLGGVTVYHFLTDIGMPVLKPDRVICRIFQRLGLIENDEQLLKAVIHGDKFAKATGHPHRYIDIVFVAYGQAATLEYGMDRGICLNDPRCTECGLTDHCRWYSQRDHAPLGP